MKAGEAGGSMLMSALNACRARLKAFIRGRTSVRDDADDILQEVTYQLMKVEQPVENVAAWLFRAARNEMTDRARKKREVSLSGYFTGDDDEDFPEDELAETLFGVPHTPEEEYLKTLLWEELGRRCLNSRRRSGRYLKRPSSTATASKCWQRRPAPANRRCYPASTRRCCFCARGCGTSMTR